MDVVADPVTLIAVARSLKGSRDPGILYRRMRGHLDAIETNHLVGPDIPAKDEMLIRKVVRFIA